MMAPIVLLIIQLYCGVIYIIATSRVEDGEWASAFFAYQFMSIFFIAVAAGLCYVVPNATGEIHTFRKIEIDTVLLGLIALPVY